MIYLPADNVEPETINGFLDLNNSDVAKCIQVGRSTIVRDRRFHTEKENLSEGP